MIDFWHGYVLLEDLEDLLGAVGSGLGLGLQGARGNDISANKVLGLTLQQRLQRKQQTNQAFVGLQHAQVYRPNEILHERWSLDESKVILEAKWDLSNVSKMFIKSLVDSIGNQFLNWLFVRCVFFGLTGVDGLPLETTGRALGKDNLDAELAYALTLDTSWQASKDACEAYINNNASDWNVD
ncbi:MAG: hypothetical protein KatS3mg087_1798 [Patescibacteria group bacterium]|nr:MAG: hypothetical protein KatS3mg087_1798 [Patescibacteria group bacterium]